MKQIVNYEDAFSIFRDYINSINSETLENLYNHFSNIPQCGLYVDIKNSQNLKKLFLLSPKELKKNAQSINKNTEYNNFLKVVNNYQRKTKDEKEKFEHEKYTTSQIKGFIDFKDAMTKEYNKFSDKKNEGIAYKIIKKLKIRTCPYCNLNYIDPIINENADENNPNEKYILRSHLDHFYPKSKYPFFALSFFNLIPSCYECNSGMKKDIDNENLVYPYLDDFDSMAKFLVSMDYKGNLNSLFSDLDSFKVILQSRDKKYDKYVTATEESLALNTRFSYRKDIVAEIIAKKELFLTKDIRKEIKEVLKLNIDREQLNRIVYGNYLDKKNIDKRPLSKLTQDILDFNAETDKDK